MDNPWIIHGLHGLSMDNPWIEPTDCKIDALFQGTLTILMFFCFFAVCRNVRLSIFSPQPSAAAPTVLYLCVILALCCSNLDVFVR